MDEIKNKKVIIAMSGGVDSSVAAALLKKENYDVIGVFMKFWKDTDEKGKKTENRCCSAEAEKKARQVAKILNIPFYVFNFEKEFKKRVVDYFLKEYKAGKTPNPCVTCNKKIKFGLLMEKALKMGIAHIATGHYAKIKNGKLFRGRDKEKDQSYFLWQLDQNQLKHVLFPIGDYKKPEVRKLAKKFKLPVTETPESQEICFIPKSVNDFLAKYIKTKPGSIYSTPGVEYIGRHEGLQFHTVGQRKGINVFSSKKTSEEKPYYVVAKDIKKNALIVSNNENDLLQNELLAKNVNWISGIEPKLPLKIKAKIRYRSQLAESVIKEKLGFKVYNLKFKVNQRAITPGQSVVFYSGNELLGGGIIDNKGLTSLLA